MSDFEDSIKTHFRLDLSRVPGFNKESQYFLLLCNGAAVTVRSQQMRAMNLAWALRHELRNQPNVAVIGGGAAGITFAAAAAKLGAKVDLYESTKLMHLQVGSWHRPLHPEIYTWPDETAYRPVSHLPMLGWTTGTANDVATEIVSKFRVLKMEMESEGQLTLHEGTQVMLTTEGSLKLKEKVNGEEKTSERRDVQIVVLAVGFGIEDSPADLPLNSYWRVDPLDQSFLGEDKPTVVVSGSGDGGLIDVLRSCVQETDQGPFLDRVLAITLRDQDLLSEIKKFDGPSAQKVSAQKVNGALVWKGYHDLKSDTLQEIDSLLAKRKRNISVKWLIATDEPFDSFALPINRFLASRLRLQAKPQGPFELECYTNVENITVSRAAMGCYSVSYVIGGKQQPTIPCQQAVIRWGPKRRDKRLYPDLFASVANAFENATPEILAALNRHLIESKSNDHKDCRLPWHWEEDDEFRTRLKPKDPPKPKLMAEFVTAFDSPDPDLGADVAPMVYRIRIWLPDLCEDLRVRYDLHPGDGIKPVSRAGIGVNHEQWLNTRNDYEIRVHTSDGFEWHVGTVLEALKRRYFELPEHERERLGADRLATNPLRVMKKQHAGTFREADSKQHIVDAMCCLGEQTRAIDAIKAKKMQADNASREGGQEQPVEDTITSSTDQTR